MPRRHSYEAGDVLEIRPRNSAENVEHFLSSIGWTPVADKLYSVTASNHGALHPHVCSLFLADLNRSQINPCPLIFLRPM